MQEQYQIKEAYDPISVSIDRLLRKAYPGRNEKFYDILLSSRAHLISTSFRLVITSQAIIKSCNSARPTWYSYFPSVERYYQEIFNALSDSMISYALDHLRHHATYRSWISELRKLKMFIFLSNTKNIASYFPSIRDEWTTSYERLTNGYAEILGPILKLSRGRAHLFIKNIANEMIIHSDKYSADLNLYELYIRNELILFQAEQNV